MLAHNGLQGGSCLLVMFLLINSHKTCPWANCCEPSSVKRLAGKVTGRHVVAAAEPLHACISPPKRGERKKMYETSFVWKKMYGNKITSKGQWFSSVVAMVLPNYMLYPINCIQSDQLDTFPNLSNLPLQITQVWLILIVQVWKKK